MQAGIRTIRHFGVTMSDLAEARDFIDAFGLDPTERDGVLIARCEGLDADQMQFLEGNGRAIHHITFGTDQGALDELARRAEAAGAVLVDGDGPGLWTRDPDGTLVNVIDEPEATPRAFVDWPSNQCGRAERIDVAMWENLPTVIKPRRLMHGLSFVSDLDASERFYTEALGMALADRAPGKATFLHGGSGDHHVFGLVASDRPGMHHIAFEVDHVDACVIGGELMARKGYTEQWGLGRHNLGSNYFNYVRAPHGLWFEYSCDIDQITQAWVGKDQMAKPWAWGPAVPADFTDNTTEGTTANPVRAE